MGFSPPKPFPWIANEQSAFTSAQMEIQNEWHTADFYQCWIEQFWFDKSMDCILSILNAYPSPKMYPIKNVEIILIMDLYAILDQINCNSIKIWKWKCLIAMERYAKLYPVDLIKAIKAIATSSPGKGKG